MSTSVLITGIVVGGIVLIVLLAVLATPSGEKRTQHPCYFRGVHVALDEPGGRKIGSQECSGPPEYSYAVQPMHPAHALIGVKVCPAHVGALQELAAALGNGTHGYWVVPNNGTEW